MNRFDSALARYDCAIEFLQDTNSPNQSEELGRTLAAFTSDSQAVRRTIEGRVFNADRTPAGLPIDSTIRNSVSGLAPNTGPS